MGPLRGRFSGLSIFYQGQLYSCFQRRVRPSLKPVVPHFEFLSELRGSFFASFAVKSFDFRLKQEPMTATFAKEGREVREEIQSEALLLSLLTFPQPSTKKYRNLVTNNLD